MNRGWRRYVDDFHVCHFLGLTNRYLSRSGTLYYKQNMQRSCCPHYTLRYVQCSTYLLFCFVTSDNQSRLEASSYKSRKDQRKAINRWNKYVLGPEYLRKAAQLCPRSREYVSQIHVMGNIGRLSLFLLTFIQGEETSKV